jgi:hypothetical protein
MIKLSILDILKNNSFGPAVAGMTKEAVLATLGEPDDCEVDEKNNFLNASIWKYAGIEFHFWTQDDGESSLSLIWNDGFEYLENLSNGKNVSLDLSFIGEQVLKYKDLVSYLGEQNVEWRVFRNKLSQAYFMYFESGAGLFLEEYDEKVLPLMDSKVVAIQAVMPFTANNYEEVT